MSARTSQERVWELEEEVRQLRALLAPPTPDPFPIKLTRQEANVARALMSGRMQSMDHLVAITGCTEETVRNKLGVLGRKGMRIRNSYGEGWMFEGWAT